MCGIIGFNSNNKELGLKMTGRIAHRGPDDEGVFCDENVTLGNRRLAILDLSPAGHQPMTSSDGRLIIVYNGEIYNFKELRKELESKGHRFASHSDTEVILNGYQEYGQEFFGQLRGMWAIAIYDKKYRKIVLSRDYFGIKPLFYYFDGRDLAFGSEIKALKEFLDAKNKKIRFSKEGVSQYFVLGYTVQPDTVYESIKKVKPGEIIDFDLTARSFTKSSISWPDEKVSYSEPELFQEFEKLMLDSVKAHLVSDVPVGIFLSGGADSTLIALMMKKLGANLNAFTVRIEGKKDADYAKRIADFAGLKYQELNFGKKEFEEQYEKCWQYLDEPIADSSLLPSLTVAKAASEKVKVVLTGEGGDELFWGYPRYQLLSGLGRMYGPDSVADFFDYFRKPDSGSYLRYIRPFMRRSRLSYLKNIKRDLLGTYIESAAIDPDAMDRSQAHQAMFGESGGGEPRKTASRGERDIAFMDRNFYLPNDLLYKTDFATMAYSIEARVPFLDRNVLKFADSLPDEWRLKDGVGKRIIKEYLAKNLPPELIFRGKEGFSVPLSFYRSDKYKKDMLEAVAFCRDVLSDLGIDNRVFDRLARDMSFMELFESKLRHFLFAALSFYKTTSKS